MEKSTDQEILASLEIPTAEKLNIEQTRRNEPGKDILSDEEIDSLVAKTAEEESYQTLPQKALTAVESAAQGVTLGLAGQAAKALGADDYLKEVAKRKAANPATAMISDVGSTIASIVATGGASAAAKGAATAGSVVKAVTKGGLAAEKAAAKAAQKFVSKESAEMLGKAGGSAFEGAAYGSGELLKENALGNADLTAESFIASATLGAMAGAGLSAAASGLGRGAKKVAEKVTTYKAKNKFLKTPEDAAVELAGLTPQQVKTQTSFNPKYKEELATFLKDDVKLPLIDDADKLSQRVLQVKEEAGKNIDDILTMAQNEAQDNFLANGTNPNIFPTKAKVFGSMASGLKDDILKPMQEAGTSSMLGPVKKLIRDYESLAKKPGTLSIKEMQRIRQTTDELIDYAKSADNMPKVQEALLQARTLLRKQIDTVVDNVDPALAQQLKIQNKRYNLAASIAYPTEKRALKSSDFIGLKDFAVAAIFDPLTSAVVVAAKKLNQSDFKRRAEVLIGLERANKKVNTSVDKAVTDFFAGKKANVRNFAAASLLTSTFSKNPESNKSPKNKEEAIYNLKKNINKLNNDIDHMDRTVASTLYKMSTAAPNTSQEALTVFMRASQFLESKLPKSVESENLFKQRISLSNFEIAKISRYVQAIENPLSILEDFKSGTLTREHVEAVKAVYPQIYKKIVAKSLEEIEKNPTMPYNKKVQISILLDVPVDETTKPEFIIARQAMYLSPEQQQAQQAQSGSSMVKPTQGGLENINKSSTYQEPNERVIKQET